METTFVEFKTVDKKGEKEYVLNRHNINYFRQYVTDAGLSTIFFMKGSDKGLIVPINHEQVKKKLQQHSEISFLLAKLSTAEIADIISHIKDNYVTTDRS